MKAISRFAIQFSPLLLMGCFAYTIEVTPQAASGEAGGMDKAQMAEVVAAITDIAHSFGLKEHPDLAFIERHSAESDVYEYRIIADFTRGADAETRYGGVILWVGVHKKTGQLGVVIRDLRHGSHTPFTRDLENTVVSALQAQFPSQVVSVEREWEGPILLAP